MRHKATDERVLEILAEGVLNASPEEIMRVAIASGIDVAALEKKVREKIAERTALPKIRREAASRSVRPWLCAPIQSELAL
ncbi:hypothetical protein CQ13_33815 [Bradyrhizobium retamae]|uniref:Uncharacterized protein n=1 Tax=Bradyrhizobium retamae TaxID=1300035 RepID=A0A0R3MGM9_9BRAD|nr:hypothetical protein CQ13_33815 [Bradyrhizobium retamae]